MEKHIEMIRKDGLTAKGKKELLRHLQGERLTHRQAILAHCYDCMGYFIDGRHDCEMSRCSLHPFMVFNRSEQKGVKRIISEAHKASLQEGRKRAVGL